jgi:hypothetical protein
MNNSRSWVVVYTLSNAKSNAVDKWQVFESYEEAYPFYSNLWHNTNVVIRSICAVIQSSDYEPHPAFEEFK